MDSSALIFRTRLLDSIVLKKTWLREVIYIALLKKKQKLFQNEKNVTETVARNCQKTNHTLGRSLIFNICIP